MNYDMCGMPISKELALRLARTAYRTHQDFPTGNKHRDAQELHDAMQILIQVQSDIKKELNNVLYESKQEL